MRRIISLSILTALIAWLLLPAFARADFAPDRLALRCINNRDCPGPNYVTFNSFINAPNPDAPSGGDERRFFEVKSSSNTSSQSGFSDSVNVAHGQRLTLRVYIHNDANPNLMGVQDAKARNTKVLVQLPGSRATFNQATAYISATNAQPQMISDTVDFRGSAPFHLTFDRNSPVELTSRIDGEGDFVTHRASGVSFSDDRNLTVHLGDWRGGFKYHGSLTFTATVHMDSSQQLPASSTCTIEVSNIDHNRATVNVRGSSQNSNISGYSFTTRNSSGQVVDTRDINSNVQATIYSFNQSSPGTYTVQATIKNDQGGTATCSREVVVSAPPATLSGGTTATPAPSRSTALPDTGSGNVAGIFAGISALAGLGHYLFRRYIG